MEELCTLGIYGLSNTGQQFAAHHARNQIRVCICDHDDPSFTPKVIAEYRKQNEKRDDADTTVDRFMRPSNTVEEMVSGLNTPRKIIIFNSNSSDGKFELLWNKLSPCLDKGDIVLRWGREEKENAPSHQFHSQSIVNKLAREQANSKEVHLLEMVRLERDRVNTFKSSNTQPDAFLVGGSEDAYNIMQPFLAPYAVTGLVGNSASCAHYALMIQRAIEFGVTQAFAEGSEILKRVAGHYEPTDVARVFVNWAEKGGKILSSYLLDITSKIIYKRDKVSGDGFVLSKIVDSIEVTPSDAWAKQEAIKLKVPAPILGAVLDARLLSGMKDEREDASSVLSELALKDTPSVLKDQISEDLQCAIYCTCMCAYAEGLSIFQAASDVESWDLNIAECVRLWNLPGSFLESDSLRKVHSAVMDDADESSTLMVISPIAAELQEMHMHWRRMVTLSFAYGISIPALSSSLTYYDTYRARTLPVGLIRAQRDYFGGNGYDRIEGAGWFTTNWTKDHTALNKKGLNTTDKPVQLDADGDEKIKTAAKKRKRQTL